MGSWKAGATPHPRNTSVAKEGPTNEGASKSSCEQGPILPDHLGRMPVQGMGRTRGPRASTPKTVSRGSRCHPIQTHVHMPACLPEA